MAESFLSPELIDTLGRLALVAERVVEGTIAGAHTSPFHGYSAEFAEHRKYTAGDPVRDLDWGVYARTDRFYIRRFREETNLIARIVLDGSASMNFAYGEKTPTKFRYGCALAASLAYLLLKQRDSVGLTLLRDGKTAVVPPSNKTGHLNHILELLETARAGGTIQLDRTISDTAAAVRRAGLIIVISDLLDDEELLCDALRQLGFRKNNVMLWHILDRAEEELPYRHLAEFVDLETGEKIFADPGTMRREYQRSLADFRKKIANFCGMNHIRYMPMVTDQPLEQQLARFLA